jgi:hypothetical protein
LYYYFFYCFFFYTNGPQLKIPYRIIYIIGFFLSAIGFVLTFIEKGEKFNFDDEEVMTEMTSIKQPIVE